MVQQECHLKEIRTMSIAVSTAIELNPIVADNRRLILLKGEVARIQPPKTLRVVSGHAWISANGEDILAAAGESVSFERSHDFAVISAMGRAPLVVTLEK